MEIQPFHLYEIYVPIKELNANEEYWIASSFDGSVINFHI